MAHAQTPPSPFDNSPPQSDVAPHTAAAAPGPVTAGLADDKAPAAATAKTDAAPVVANKYLSTFMTLQRQIALLTQMLERERSVADIVDNYKKMGIAYAAPKPDLKICQDVPNNLSCAMAYPEVYPDFLPPPSPLPAVPIMPVMVSADELPQAIANLSPDSGLKNLMWTDITCLQGACRAVITPEPGNLAARYSVKAGDSLPPGGTVQRISFDGVTIIDGTKIIHVPPAPTRPMAL